MQYSRQFADISSNNTTPDMRIYHHAGHILIAIKATEGINYTNPDHRNWCLHAGLNWVSVVHYHYARPDLDNDPVAEANHFLDAALPLAGWWDYLAVDVERGRNGQFTGDPAWVREFDQQVQHRSRFATILYASRSTLELSNAWLVGDRKRVWDADWSNTPDYAPPGYACAFRQFTDGTLGPEPHTLVGVGQCDINTMSAQMFKHLTSRYRHTPGW